MGLFCGFKLAFIIIHAVLKSSEVMKIVWYSSVALTRSWVLMWVCVYFWAEASPPLFPTGPCIFQSPWTGRRKVKDHKIIQLVHLMIAILIYHIPFHKPLCYRVSHDTLCSFGVVHLCLFSQISLLSYLQ